MARDQIAKHNRLYCGSRTRAECDVERARVIDRGRATLARMRGTGWHLRVWENLGWHYELVNGPVHLHDSAGWREKQGKFWCMISGDMTSDSGGLGLWTGQCHQYRKNPTTAVADAVLLARGVVDGLLAVVERAESVQRSSD